MILMLYALLSFSNCASYISPLIITILNGMYKACKFNKHIFINKTSQKEELSKKNQCIILNYNAIKRIGEKIIVIIILHVRLKETADHAAAEIN